MKEETFKEVLEGVKDTEKKKDEFLKVARLQRHERDSISEKKLKLFLDYFVVILVIVFLFTIVIYFMHTTM